MARPKEKENTMLVKISSSNHKGLHELSKKENKSMRDMLDLIVSRKVKGQITELATIFWFILAIAVISALFWVVGDQLTDSFRESGYNETAADESFFQKIEDSYKMGDTVVAFATVIISLFLFAVAYLLPTNFIFAVFFTGGAFILWMITPIISNVWESFTSSGSLATAAAALPFTNTLLLNMPKFGGGLLFALIIVFYGKNYVTNR